MTQAHPSHSSLLQEASSIDTSAERLQELFRVDPSLGPAIASNPSASFQLLDQLALHCPAEVLANPLLLLSALETAGAYGDFSLRSLISLCLACDPQQDAGLLKETRRRIRVGLDELRKQETASLTCIWLHQGNFTLRPKDCDNLIDIDIDFKVKSEAFVEGEDVISLRDIPELEVSASGSDASQRATMAQFLGAIASNQLQEFIDDSEIVREHSGALDFILEAIGLPKEYECDGRQLLKGGEPLFEFGYHFGDGILFEGGYLEVGIGDIEEVDLKIDVSMGELIELIGFEPTSAGDCPADWPRRLASLLIP